MTLRTRIFLQSGVAAVALTASFAAWAEEPVPAAFDGNGKTYNISPRSILRQGEGFLTGVVTTIGNEPTTIQGAGVCTQAACPVTYDGKTVYARRTRLTLPGGKKETTAQKVENALHLPVTELVDHTLRRGDEGRSVLHLQEALNKNGAGLTIDSKYSRTTEDAVRSYQEKKNIKTDGVAGPETLKSLGIYKGEKG